MSDSQTEHKIMFFLPEKVKFGFCTFVTRKWAVGGAREILD